MGFEETTLEYYGKWLGADAFALYGEGFSMIPLKQREAALPGYPSAMSVYALKRQNRLAVSYAPHLNSAMCYVRDAVGGSADIPRFEAALSRYVQGQRRRGWKFIYAPGDSHLAEDTSAARLLTADDFPAYRAFHWTLRPGGDDWLWDYYKAFTAKGFCHGVFVENKLVAAVDAPDMPFMADAVAELGVNTVPAHRNRGYAKAACIATARAMANRGLTPMWSCAQGNEASFRLALSVGFRPLAEYLTISV